VTSSHHRSSWPVRVALVILASVLAACSSSAGKPSGASRATLTASAGSEQSATSSSRVTAGTHSLVVLACNVTSTVFTVRFYDPASGTMTDARTFNLNTSGQAPGYHCTAPFDPPPHFLPSYAYRQFFNADYSLMAVEYNDFADGSRRIEVVDTQGGVRDLTSAASGFSSAPQDYNPLFNPSPQDDRLWYADAQSHLYSVDPSQGIGSTRPEAGRAGNTKFYFSPSGRRVIPFDSTATLTGLVDPTDTYQVEVAGDEAGHDGVRVGRVGTVTSSTPVVELPEVCSPVSWVDRQRFLCTTSDDTGVSLVTLNAAHTGARTRPLLPRTDRRVYDPVPSPDGRSFAFLSFQGATLSLFVSPLATGGSPKKVADLDSTAADTVSLPEWR
jgi:hypothetical protein